MKLSASDQWDMECMAKATHFTVWDAHSGERPQFLKDFAEAVSVMENAIANNTKQLVYGFHYKPGIDITCFAQVLFTPGTLKMYEEFRNGCT